MEEPSGVCAGNWPVLCDTDGYGVQQKDASLSFPSGHTLWAFIEAFIWSELIPEKQKEFIALAEEIRRSREIMGIHYPSDNEASRQIAYKMLQYYSRTNTSKRISGSAG